MSVLNTSEPCNICGNDPDYKISSSTFRPVQCTENILKNKSPVNGFLYFATDSKKIYLGKEGKFLPMGGSTGIYYGTRVAEEGEADSEVTSFQFIIGLEIEGDQIPNVDDLILNAPDGGFYRVTGQDLSLGVIIAEKLAVAGGGGGSTPGGGARPNIQGLNTNSTFFSLSDPENMVITFSAISPLTENNYIDVIEYKIGGQTFYDNNDYEFGQEIKFEFHKYLKYLNTQGNNNITILVQDAWGNRSSARPIAIKIFDLRLETTMASIISFSAEQEKFNYLYTPRGGDDSGLKRYLEIGLAPLDNPGDVKIIANQPITSLGAELGVNIDFPAIEAEYNMDIEHGVYLLTAVYKAYAEEEDTLLVSNSIQHQIVYLEDSSIPLIATSFVDQQVVPQYSTYYLDYLVAEGNVNRDIEVLFYIDDNTSIPEQTQLNTVRTWEYTFTVVGAYTLFVEYNGVKQRLGTINVEKYSDEDIPDVNFDICELNLVATGKANTHSNREDWSWKNGGQTYSAKFENFLWGQENGWLRGPDGDPALKLTNGAKLTIPSYRPFERDAVATGLTIEVDFMLSNILDYSKPLISCLSNTFRINENGEQVVDSVNTGFQITGQKATLNSKNYKATTTAIVGEEDKNGKISESDMALQALTQYFNEDTRIHLTYVIEKYLGKAGEFYFVYTYMNGVLSGIMKLDSGDAFLENPANPAIFSFDSTHGDIYIYSIRTVRQALNPNLVIEHWMADINNVDKKIALNKNNAVFNMNSRVDKKVIDSMSVALGVPYVVFEGGIPMPKKFKKKNLTDPDNDIKDGGYHPNGYTFSNLDSKLPVTKSDFRLMSMKMYDKSTDGTVRTILDVPMELEDAANSEHIISDFDEITTNGKYWFKRGVQVYGQGTSSMVYPVKNLRLKFMDSKDYPTVYEGSVPVEIVCFKADFMDSAASHNTCTGNLVYDLYNSIGLKTPPQVFKSQNDYDIVTAIKGFPIICFYKNYNTADSGHNDEYIYIGRYNFNLDKATPEPFGFPGMYRETGETVVDDQGRTRKVVEVCGLLTEEVNNKKVLPLDAEGKEKKIDITQCWEILNNDTNSPTKFLTPTKTGGGRYLNYEAALRDSWIKYYEDRYPDEIVGLQEKGKLADDPFYSQALEDGLFRLSLWINSTAREEAQPSVALAEPIYYKTLHKTPQEGITYYNASYNPVTLTLIDAINIQVNNSQDTSIAKTDVTVDKDMFTQAVNGVYDSYTFSYDGENWSRFVIVDDVSNSIPVSLSDYGILVSASDIKDGQTIIVELFSDWDGWVANELYEKHTHDTVGYRLAKFKNEFTQYFNMDFCLFYYVLTLTLLMMDSRAKNMMLASWDTKIWYPIFYDMDTMLGLNNTGFNKFSYDTEDDPADQVFNGYDSVLWNNFRECFPREIADFYVSLRNHMTFNKLMETYNAKGADAWNEALITQDAIYKYERPYEKGYYDGKEGIQVGPGQVSYLYAAQGRRSNHRAWWLKNRLGYLDSKYKPESLGNEKPSQADTFSFRAYGLPSQKSSAAALDCVQQTPANHAFNLTALTNSYQSIFIGNIVYGPRYTLANQTVTLGPDQPKHEVESYILNPSLIADLGDLSDKYIGSWNMPANKLTALRFGRSSRSHPEAYDKYFNSLLTALNIGSSTPYLNYLNVARCTGLPNLDISTCNKLETLDAEGSRLVNVTFPQDSILKEVYLPRSLGSLSIRNQPHLETLEFDSRSINNRKLEFSSFELLNVNKINSYPIAKEVFDTQNGVRYALTGLNWVIDDFEETTITSIPILEALINNPFFIPLDGYSRASALTGTITLNGKSASEKLIVNEFDLYNKYKAEFPDLEIRFGPNVTLTAAARIKFKTTDNVADTQIHYEVLCDPTKELTLKFLTSASGPAGVALTDPVKASSASHDYVFTGYWCDASNRLNRYYNDRGEDFVPDAGATYFGDFKPTGDVTFIPEYTSKPRVYTVTFQDDKGNIILQEDVDGNQIERWNVGYGKKYDGPMKNYYYKDESQLPLEQKYTFLGWSTSRNAVKPTFIDPSDLTIESSITLYAYFKQESVYLTPAKLEYFTIQGGSIKLKSEYKSLLKGKVTLPLVDGSGKAITAIGADGFKDCPYITHIFFQQSTSPSAYTVIGNNAFSMSDAYGMNSLEYVKLPDGILTLDDKAFHGCYSLKNIVLPDSIVSIGTDCFSAYLTWDKKMQVSITKLPNNLTTLGNQAFWNAGENVAFTYIPDGVTEIPPSCFFNCTSLAIEEFGSDSGTGLTSIATSAFELAGSNIIPGFSRVIFRKSVKNIALPDPNNTFARAAFRSSYVASAGMTMEIHNEDLYQAYMKVNQFVGFGDEPRVEGPAG